MLTLVDTKTMQTFVYLSKDVAQQQCSQLLYDTQLKFVKSGYFLGGLVPELRHKERDNNCVIERSTYPKRLQRIFGTVEFVAEKTLKNGSVLPAVASQILKIFCVTKVLLILCTVTPDTVRANEFDFYSNWSA